MGGTGVLGQSQAVAMARPRFSRSFPRVGAAASAASRGFASTVTARAPAALRSEVERPTSLLTQIIEGVAAAFNTNELERTQSPLPPNDVPIGGMSPTRSALTPCLYRKLPLMAVCHLNHPSLGTEYSV